MTWRAADGSVLGTGSSLTVVPAAATERYVLEGYSPSLDAYGRDTLTLHPRLGAILSLSPNPATTQVEVSYSLAPSVQSATLAITGSLGTPLLSVAVDPAAGSHTLNLLALPAGQYQLRLSAGGTLVDARTLVVQ